MKVIGNVFLYIWQILQNLAGLVCLLFCKGKEKKVKDGITYYVVDSFFGSGVSLGNYIILDKLWEQDSNECYRLTVHHEHGHQFQSKCFGPLYLIVIGIPSFIGNIIDRIRYSKGVSYRDRMTIYYQKQPWEKGADFHGGILEDRDKFIKRFK